MACEQKRENPSKFTQAFNDGVLMIRTECWLYFPELLLLPKTSYAEICELALDHIAPPPKRFDLYGIKYSRARVLIRDVLEKIIRANVLCPEKMSHLDFVNLCKKAVGLVGHSIQMLVEDADPSSKEEGCWKMYEQCSFTDQEAKEICDIALNNHPAALKWMPGYLKTKANCEAALKKDGFQFIWVP